MITDALRIIETSIEEEPTARAFVVNDGDCGLVIRKDGTVECFQQQINTAALQKLQSSLTSEEQQTLLNGQLLMALSIVAHSPELQQTILNFAVNEGVAGIPAANANVQ
ncbi:hypothetical protein [Pararhizobium qamdonense]|uniref:hypothetical protein n=1 Tax=Pararhizobium qamdonense TaxID=3031126 RepID=UPI0023E25CEA|nr:hypothetical protein [Pararhizobium qamdonense]